MGITFTGGMNLSGGMNMTTGGGGGSWATIDQASASTQLSIVGNQVTITGDLTNSVGFSRTNGAKSILIAENYSFEVLVNNTGGSSPYFYAGVIGVENFSNNTYPQNPINYLQGFGFGPGSTAPHMWNFDFVGQAFFDPAILVSNNDILGITVSMNGDSTLLFNLYKNGTLILSGYGGNFVGLAGNLVSILIGWRFTGIDASVTLRTDPATFSYGGSYTNQNGWPA